MPETKHILSSFDTALADLRADGLMMASLTERNLQNAFGCLLNHDLELCAVAIADEEEIDALQTKVDADGIEVLTRYQPVASDLRQVIATMRFSANLERVADQAAKIARRGRKLGQGRTLPETDLIEPMFLEAMLLFHDSVRAFADCNVDLARTIRPRDRKIDELNRRIAQTLTKQMGANPKRIPDYLNLTFIARHLERVGDHSKNIAEDTVYAAAAEDIRFPNNAMQPDAD